MTDEDLGRAVAQAAVRYSTAMEATASVALSHDPTCLCVVCRAADGDLDAIRDVLRILEEGSHGR